MTTAQKQPNDIEESARGMNLTALGNTPEAIDTERALELVQACRETVRNADKVLEAAGAEANALIASLSAKL